MKASRTQVIRMPRYCMAFIFLLICMKGMSQHEIDVSATLSDSITEKTIIQLKITNLSKKPCVLGLQNWQVVYVPKSASKPVWSPLKADLVNFLYLVEDLSWHPNNLYYLDWAITMDSVTEASLKILQPGNTFTITLLINESLPGRFDTGNNPKINIAYLFSLASYRDIQRNVETTSNVFFHANHLMIRDLRINHKFLDKPSITGKMFHNPDAPFANIDFIEIRNLFKRRIVYKKGI